MTHYVDNKAIKTVSFYVDLDTKVLLKFVVDRSTGDVIVMVGTEFTYTIQHDSYKD